MIWRLAPYAGAVALAGAVWWHGAQWGESRAEARYERAVAALNARLGEVSRDAALAEAARLAIERQRNDLLNELDRAGRDDPDAERRALGADSVRRINSIGGPD